MLQAESEESYDSWISALQRGIGQALQLGQHDKITNSTPDSSPYPQKGSQGTNTPGDSPASSSPATTPQAPTANKAMWDAVFL